MPIDVHLRDQFLGCSQLNDHTLLGVDVTFRDRAYRRRSSGKIPEVNHALREPNGTTSLEGNLPQGLYDVLPVVMGKFAGTVQFRLDVSERGWVAGQVRILLNDVLEDVSDVRPIVDWKVT